MNTNDVVALEARVVALAEKLAKANFRNVTATEAYPGTPRDYLGTLRLNLKQLAKACEAISKELATREAL